VRLANTVITVEKQTLLINGKIFHDANGASKRIDLAVSMPLEI
jgi:hypothetical protein